MQKRRVGVIALVSVLALSFVSCGGDDDDSSSGDDGGGVTVTTAGSGTPVAVELGETSDTEYFMTAAPESVPAGSVTFTAKNTGSKEHEMVVLKTDEAPDSLTVTDDKATDSLRAKSPKRS
jgi:hypothetical protein